MKSRVYYLAGFLAVLAGCSSDSNDLPCNPDTDNCSADCVDGEKMLNGICTKTCEPSSFANVCENSVRVYCSDGFVVRSKCADNEICADGHCDVKPGEENPCPEGEKLLSGTCTKTCEASSFSNACDEQYRVYCREGFVTKAKCADSEFCKDGRCDAKPGQDDTCPEGEKLLNGTCTKTCESSSFTNTCEDEMRVYCDDGFVARTRCADNEICNNGQCNVKPGENDTCPEGEKLLNGTCTKTCESSSFTNTCEDEMRVYCDEGFVAKVKCAEGDFCSKGQCVPDERIRATCGNGIVENLKTGKPCADEEPSLCEACDDGNTTRLDGCSDICTIEIGWTCVNGKDCAFLDEEGKAITDERFKSLIVVDVKVVDGEVKDVGPNQVEQKDWNVYDDEFGDGKLNIPENMEAGTLQMLVDYDRSSHNALLDWRQYNYYESPMYGLHELVSNSVQGAGIVTIPGWYPPGGVANLHAQIAKNTPVLNNGIAFWAVYGNVQTPLYGIRVNGRHADTDRNDFKIDKVTNYYPDHKYKEIIVYSRVLTQRELDYLYAKADIKIVPDDTPLIGRVFDGLSELGPALAFTRTPNGYPKWYDEAKKTAGKYSVEDGNGLTLDYEIKDFVEVVNSSAEGYESVHIIKKPVTLPLGYKYALSAIPYPYDVHGDDDDPAQVYDVTWISSDPSVAVILDGIVIPKKTGKVTMTARLSGTDLTDSCTIEIVERKLPQDKPWSVPADYRSKAGDSFSDTDYEMTTRAIYAAIDEANENGFNHVIFPQIEFHAQPIVDKNDRSDGYQIPQAMTIEFPKGSVFYMEDSEVAKKQGYIYFQIGYGWSDATLPVDDENQVLYEAKSDVHIIIDEFHGEMLNNKAHKVEEFAWGNCIASMTRYAEFSTVEVHYADYTTGMFITMGGEYNPGNNQPSGSGRTLFSDYEKGWICDDGQSCDKEHWIRTKDYIVVPKGYGMHALDKFSEYYIGPFAGRPALAQGHLYDIVWYDENKKLIQADRWQYISEFYDNRPENAAYFRLAIQKDDLPTKNSDDYQGIVEYVGMHEGSPTRFCEVRNSTAVHTADGLVSCVGEMDACWIHHNYVTKGETKNSDWAIDLEDGFLGMRRTILENNIVPAPLYLSGGFNNVVISNYIDYLDIMNYSAELNRVINNTCYSLNMTEKINAHIYHNVYTELKLNPRYTSNGSVFEYENKVDKFCNYY